MAKLTITKLKKQLSKKSKQELIQDISKICQLYPQVKEYYIAQSADIHDLLAKYADIIEEEFTGIISEWPKARLSVGKKAIADFRKLTKNPELIADIMLTYVYSLSWFCTSYNPDYENYYTSAEDMFEKVLKLIKKNNLKEKFKERASSIVENATQGWEHKDSLQERYEEVYGELRKG